MIFQENINRPNFTVVLPLIFEIWGNMCSAIISQIVTSKFLKLTSFFYSSRFSTGPKSQDENLNILTTKRVFTVT